METFKFKTPDKNYKVVIKADDEEKAKEIYEELFAKFIKK